MLYHPGTIGQNGPNLLAHVIQGFVWCDVAIFLHQGFQAESFLRQSYYLARKAIALRWMSNRSPSLAQWRNMANSILPYNRMVYKNRGCPDDFMKIWGKWCDSPNTLYLSSHGFNSTLNGLFTIMYSCYTLQFYRCFVML